MSLVNDTLKDLETRWPDAEAKPVLSVAASIDAEDLSVIDGEADDGVAKTPELGVRPSRKGPRALVALGLVVFVSVLLAGQWLMKPLVLESEKKRGSEDQTRRELLTPLQQALIEPSSPALVNFADSDRADRDLQPGTVVSELHRGSNQVVKISPPVEVEVEVELPEPLELPAIAERIETLLLAGQVALQLDRLTTPREDNAYDRFRAILALQPEHTQAREGLQRVRDRYLEIVEIAIIKKYFYKVPELLKKAREIGVTQATINTLIASLPEANGKPTREVIQRIAEYEQSRGRTLSSKDMSSKDMSSKNMSSQSRPSSGVSSDAKLLDIVLPDSVPPARESVVVDPAVTAKAGSSDQGGSITQNLNNRDRQIAQQAAQLLERQQYPAAQKLLTLFIEAEPTSVHAYQQLFNVYIQQGQLTQAEQLIEAGGHLSADIFSYMVAQLLVQRQDLAGALRALQSQSPELSAAPHYYALLAGLYHKLGESSQALKGYRQLLALDRLNATYWLGLAVALDSLQEVEALSAFQQTLALANDEASYRTYVKGRIAVLSATRSPQPLN